MSGEKGCLTKTDREYLRGEKEYDSKQARYSRRKSIRDGVRGALRDFRLLADELDDEEREQIFDVEPRSDELRELIQDVSKTVEFLYAGMGGEAGFRRPLKTGVANGELALGNVENALAVAPRFTLNRVYQPDKREIVDLVEAEEWERVSPPDLFTFVRLALTADALDFDPIRDRLDMEEWGGYVIGKKRRAIPGGGHTPLMDPEVFDREGIGDMSVEELRDLFGDGYSGTTIYDGEKVVRPPPPGTDAEPEIIDWFQDPPTEDE